MMDITSFLPSVLTASELFTRARNRCATAPALQLLVAAAPPALVGAVMYKYGAHRRSKASLKRLILYLISLLRGRDAANADIHPSSGTDIIRHICPSPKSDTYIDYLHRFFRPNRLTDVVYLWCLSTSRQNALPRPSHLPFSFFLELVQKPRLNDPIHPKPSLIPSSSNPSPKLIFKKSRSLNVNAPTYVPPRLQILQPTARIFVPAASPTVTPDVETHFHLDSRIRDAHKSENFDSWFVAHPPSRPKAAAVPVVAPKTKKARALERKALGMLPGNPEPPMLPGSRRWRSTRSTTDVCSQFW